ncbi:MAG: hypothetical protein MR615_02750 [Prevotella sp.]|nr:hypothetical protein [Prevotella sp.]
MVTLYDFYDLSQQNMTNDSKLETAAKTLNETADMFESELEFSLSVREINTSSDSRNIPHYDISGRRATGSGLRIVRGKKIYVK